MSARKLSLGRDIASIGTEPVPARPYYDPEYLLLEKEAIFKRSWLMVGRAREVPEPGSFIVRDIDIAKASILIVRGKDRKIRAFHNVCPHRGSQLSSRKEGKTSVFSCRYHAWSFNVDGTLRGIPDKDGFFDLPKKSCNLVPVDIDELAGFLFVCLSRPEQSLQDFLGEAGERLRSHNLDEYELFAELDNVIEANWKTVQDNFQETYHVATVHQRTLVPLVTTADNPRGAPWYEVYGPHRRMVLWRNYEYVPPRFSGLPRSQIRPDGEASSSTGGDGLDVHALFPNTHIDIDFAYYFTHQFWPLSANSSRLIARIYMRRARTARERVFQEFMISFTRDVWAEDWPLILSVQRGIRSGALEHVHFHAHEVTCRHLYNAITARVADYLCAQRDERRAQ